MYRVIALTRPAGVGRGKYIKKFILELPSELVKLKHQLTINV